MIEGGCHCGNIRRRFEPSYENMQAAPERVQDVNFESQSREGRIARRRQT